MVFTVLSSVGGGRRERETDRERWTDGQTDKDVEQRKVNIAIIFSNKEVMHRHYR